MEKRRLERQQITKDPNIRTSRSTDGYNFCFLVFFFFFCDISITLNKIFLKITFFYGRAKLLLENKNVSFFT